MAVRTRFYDQFFVDATRSGIRQAVIVAAGLDARAYRLPWPQGTVVYEVDLPDVIDFKTSTLSKQGAAPTPSVERLPLTCATTGLRPCGPPASTRKPRRHGAPRG